MTVVPWPEWTPDQADFGNPGSALIKNCVPATPRSYGPMPSSIPHSTNTLVERCQGSYSLKAKDNTVYLFAGDREKLYVMLPGSRELINISRTTGGPYNTVAPGSGGAWQMTSFGSRVLATNGTDPIQSLMLPVGVDPHFADLSSTAPKAKYIATVKDFLMVANTNDSVGGPMPFRVWWSAINDPDNWPTPGSVPALQLQSDYNDLVQTDLGNITGLQSGFAPGSDVVIFCERGIYTAAYSGPPLLFQFRVAQGASGCTSPLSILQDHARNNSGSIVPVCYYLSPDGFAAFDGNTSFPIGAQKFDKAFFRDVDDTYIGYVQGASDPRTRTLMWAYPSTGSEGLFNRLVVYSWELGRGTLVELDPPMTHVEWITTSMFALSYTLDQLDQFGHLDVIQPSLDDPFWTGNAAERFSLFTRDHRLNIGGGPAMAPMLETSEMQPFPDRRAWVRMIRPLIDGGIATVQVGHRERLTDQVTWELPVPINQLGTCPQRATGRYVRFRLAMPEAQDFRHLQGLDLQMIPEAIRR